MTERPDLTLEEFPQRRELFVVEGGCVYLDERDQRFYVITDESTILGMLSEEDAAGLSPVSIREFRTEAERGAYLAERGWARRGGTSLDNQAASGLRVQWYGERGIVNALVNHLARAARPVEAVRALLSAVRWAAPRGGTWVETFTKVTIIVELGLADFGNPDLLLVCDGPDGVRLVFVEAKVAPYLASMRPNKHGMTLPGFNSSINGQLALKYRFARALEASSPGVLALLEPEALRAAYASRLRDGRSMPRRLSKLGIVRDTLTPLGLLGLSESHCEYVALTWDAPERAFFTDPDVERLDGRPVFLSGDGRDLWPETAGRVGWLGYQALDSALRIRDDADYQKALATMLEGLVPTAADYAATLDSIAAGPPEAVPLMAKLAGLFKDYEVVEYKGSFSVKDRGQTIGKIMRRGAGVFVGLRDSTNPSHWFPGPLDEVSVQGVVFRGLVVPVDSPDSPDAATLVSGLSDRQDT